MCAISASQPMNTSTTLQHLCPPIPGSQCLLVRAAEVPFIHPERHALPRQPGFSIEISPLHTHEPIAIDRAQPLDFAEEAPQRGALAFPWHRSNHRTWCMLHPIPRDSRAG
jgi:hypothetical protein